MTLRTSEVAESCSNASSRSRASCTVSASRLAAKELRRRTIDALRRLGIALRPSVRGSAQRSEYQDVAARNELCTWIHVADDDDVADLLQRLSTAHRAAVVPGRDGVYGHDARAGDRGKL